MRIEHEITLNRPRSQVWAAFDDSENLKIWQPTLRSIEPISGDPGQPGARARLLYDEDGREVVLLEEITARREPELFSGTYTAPGVVSTIDNSFLEPSAGHTRWKMTTEFQFSGLMRLMAAFMRGSMRKRSIANMEQFKQALEAGALDG